MSQSFLVLKVLLRLANFNAIVATEKIFELELILLDLKTSLVYPTPFMPVSCNFLV